MKCRDCKACKKGWFSSSPDEYVCIGVPDPFVIDDVDTECTEYEDKRSRERRDMKDKETITKALEACSEYLCDECPYKYLEDRNFPLKCIHTLIVDLSMII